MENIYFKGLDKALNDGCHIKVFICSFGYPVVRVERKNNETKKDELIAYAENENVISALNTASCNIINELANTLKSNLQDKIQCENTLIDKVIREGYTLHFFKLSNGQILSTICDGGAGNYIPIKSVITNNIKTGFKTLNATLKNFNLDNGFDFIDFAGEQTEPVKKFQINLLKNKNNN